MPARTDLAAHYRDLPVLVTGGAGFIGSHLTRALVSLGARVTVIDDLSGGSEENLSDLLPGAASPLEPSHPLRFVQASILDCDALEECCRGVALVFHEAALASVPASIEQPRRYLDVNITGTQQLLETAVRCGVRRVVFASSSSVYGDQPVLPKVENQMPDPLSPYAQEKLTGEHLMRVWALCYGLRTVCLRYFNIFGPGQRADSAYAAVVAAFANALLKGRRPSIFGDGSASRDFTYVDDVVQANLLAGSIHGLDARPADEPMLAGGVMNIARGDRVTVLELARLMAEIVGIDAPPEFKPPRFGDVLHSQADISRARKWLGYEPRVSVRDGLRATLDWYRSILD
ncbi:MAG: NAD-dependent epimerase/dehydratase family protein [Phycisphaerales bacterium]|nr:NAD-dependent epimerase/dehydratase family protein [Phycisphaerales bacterium]